MTVDPNPVDAETARKLFAQPCDFMLAAAAPGQFPETALPEIALIGRSNVGKSSLINALTGRKNLARASNTPGRTQQIVFFNLGNRLILADLPGYGHAQAPVEEKEKWAQLVQLYFRSRRNLKNVCLLLDGRHGAKTNDLEMMKTLDRAAAVYKVVLTKMDQVKNADRPLRMRQTEELAARHPAALSGLLPVSSESKEGIAELRAFIAGFAAPRP